VIFFYLAGHHGIDSNNLIIKSRNFAKGGRRNWKQKWFVLYKDGTMHYYGEKPAGGPDGDSSAGGAGGGAGGGSLAQPEPDGKFSVREAHWHVHESKPEQMLLSPIREWGETAALQLRHSDVLARRAWLEVMAEEFGNRSNTKVDQPSPTPMICNLLQ
jgi:hypothetical protein